MIIEEQLPTPKGYLSARLVTFRGDAAETATTDGYWKRT